MEIWGSQSGVMREVLETNSIRPEEVGAIGITNQRGNNNSMGKKYRKTRI